MHFIYIILNNFTQTDGFIVKLSLKSDWELQCTALVTNKLSVLENYNFRI